MTKLFEKLRCDPGPSFSLADVFLFAQIPDLRGALPASLIAFYAFLLSVTSGKSAKRLRKFDLPIKRAFLTVYPHVPFLNRLAPSEFNKKNRGSAILSVGICQLPVFLGSLVVAATDPFNPIGWMAAAATAFFAAGNIKAGYQLNDSSRVKAHKNWIDVLSSVQVLDAAGICVSGLMAGLVESFGIWVVVPIAVSLVSASLVALGKIGNVRLNTGIPMAALTACAVLNTIIGIANGRWLAALSNAFSINGERILTQFYISSYGKSCLGRCLKKDRRAFWDFFFFRDRTNL